MSGRVSVPIEPAVNPVDEWDDRANHRRLVRLTMFVAAFATVSLAVYLWMRPANRHLEPTPYEGIISQLRSDMSEQDVLAIFRAAKDGVPRAEVSAFNEVTPSGTQRVLAYRVGVEEPLRVLMGGPTGNTIAQWCYMDHCHDNIE